MLSYLLEHGVGILVVEASGRVPQGEALKFLAQVQADPRTVDFDRDLIDLRGMEWTDLDYGTVTRVAERLRPGKREPRRIAVVATSPLPYGLGRMLQEIAENRYDPRVALFSDAREARRWLLATADSGDTHAEGLRGVGG